MTDIFEINLAQRLLLYYQLTPPIDVFALAEKYADVEFDIIPLNIDGASLDLKQRGRRPTIILNKARAQQRIRFTLAHELGHVLIPWHIGNVIDASIDNIKSYQESEANRFAAELLMPAEWVSVLVGAALDPPALISEISRTAKVSNAAAAFRAISFMLPGIVFAYVTGDNKVIRSGRSPHTFANQPHPGSTINPQSAYPIAEKLWSMDYPDDERFILWKLPDKVVAKTTDHREWRVIFAEIIADLERAGHNAQYARQSINGVIGSANSTHSSSSEESMHAVLLQRFYSRAQQEALYQQLIKHPKFNAFLVQRIRSLLSLG